MSEQSTPTTGADAEDAAARRLLEETAAKHDHDEAAAEEWEDESFPASDPPSNY